MEKMVGEGLANDPAYLEEPLINKMKNKLPKHKPRSYWWKTIPEWYKN